MKLARLFVLPALAGLTIAACTVNSTDNDDDGATTDPTTTSGGGEGGTGNVGNAGGEGGTGAVGAAGGAGGGTGGSAPCVGADGTGQTGADCDDTNQMPIAAAPDTCTADGQPLVGDQEPLGLITCRRGFEVYLPGAAEFLFDELAKISVTPADACSHDNVTNAITAMHAAACPNQTAQNACSDFKMACDADGLPNDTLDQANCDFLLNPFNDTALAEVIDCINNSSADTPCDDVVATCWDLQLNPP